MPTMPSDIRGCGIYAAISYLPGSTRSDRLIVINSNNKTAKDALPLNRRWTRWLWVVLTAGSLALLVYLVLQTNLTTVVIVWKRFTWRYALLALLLYFVLNFLRSLRFNVLLKDH